METNSETKPIASNFFLYPVGKELELRVVVTDPQIAQIALFQSRYAGLHLLAGMRLLSIRFDDLERKDAIIAWLRLQLANLERHTASSGSQLHD